jgi:protein disulfide-isomerase A6
MVKFLSQAGAPNPDPAPLKGKADKKSKDSSSSAKAKAKTASSSKSSSTTTTESEEPTKVPTQEAPVIVETAIPIPAIHTQEKLVKECLTDKSNTCVLAFVPASAESNEGAKAALSSLSNLAFKYAQGKRHLFPFFEVPRGSASSTGADLLKALDLSADIEIIAINARRGWWRRFEGGDFGHEAVEGWIDAIRLSEGVKRKLPEGIVAISVEDPAAASTESASSEGASESTGTNGADPLPESETEANETASKHVHEEL